ncbi:hypothetical protein SAMN06295974_3871 [Plantibacter flavus]|uniref:Uncharacterized protein n=1 Tax=Plantibacter flavus TaxID=150123 RepID=A0A3N2BLS2_9MICO|nr:hypothetical protein [Plantibacter flavus]ROR75984.1 hypothetical protein EDD42_3935 [Plantibacter flavus]SMG49613.1 hypothetical protein SAMN06295974_3871 [Plantibacter flavus]
MNSQQAPVVDELTTARDAVVEAVRTYRLRVEAVGSIEGVPIGSTTADGPYSQRYRMGDHDVRRLMREDPVLAAAADADRPVLEQLLLSSSPHWEDRVRAAALERHLRSSIRLPDGFPCIYEPADSPRNAGLLRPRDEVWVASPDVNMLNELLPLYQELWTAYEDQWPHSPNRVFVVGRLDGVSPTSVYRPGTTPGTILGDTMLTHSDMYRRAPAHLKHHHPLHDQWAAARSASGSTSEP